MRKIYLVIILLLSIPTAYAGDNGLQDMFSGIEAVGGKTTIKQDGDAQVITQVFDLQKMTESFQLLQKIGLLNPDITQTGMNVMPVSIDGFAALEITGLSIAGIYKFTQANLIRIEAYMQITDDYGHQSNKLIYSCDFSRALYKKIDWAHFKATNLPKVAPSFKYASWYTNKVRSEMQMNQ